jgi:hypothetical protein
MLMGIVRPFTAGKQGWSSSTGQTTSLYYSKGKHAIKR